MKIPDLPKQSCYPKFSGQVIYDPYTGEAHTLQDWAKRYGITSDALRYYVKNHSWDDFFTFYPLVQKSHAKYRGKTRRVRR